MILSIIIPAYNAEPYIHELLKVLEPQIVPEVEVIVIDDGSKKPLEVSYPWAKVIRQVNQGASAARNTGLNHSKGEYIAFIDADDLVVEDYIAKLLKVINDEKPDYIYLSWKAFGGWNYTVKLTSITDKFPPFNLCVWNRVYKRSMIGKVRFNTSKVVAEDAQFIRDVKEEGRKKAFISDYMYLYRSDTPDSLTKRVTNGLLNHNRIVYNMPVVPNSPELLEEIKKADKTAEVIVMTHENQLKGLEEYAMVIPPRQIVGTELRGEFTPLFTKQQKPYVTQIVLYIDNLFEIGGIETFTYNFCKWMHKYYDIAVVYTNSVAEKQYIRLLPYADIVKVTNQMIVCDVAINCRIHLVLPSKIRASKKINLVHTCKMNPAYHIADSPDEIYFVSDACRRSFDLEGGVIYNLTAPEPVKNKPLRLVSACRLTWEKGQNRIMQLAQLMNEIGIEFTWEVFTSDIPDMRLTSIPSGLVFRQQTLNVKDWIAQADFYISLSTWESFGFSMVEALELGVPVITTPLDVLPEIGFIEGVNGFVIPMSIESLGKHYLKAILSSDLKFKYTRQEDNERIVEQWRRVLGDKKPTRKAPAKDAKIVRVIKNHFDAELDRSVRAGEILLVRKKRAESGIDSGFYQLVDV